MRSRLAVVRGVVHALAGVVVALVGLVPAASAQSQDWATVDYGPLVDRRQLSHSGESVGALLDKLAGRPVPQAAAQAPHDQLAHSLLEPLIEPYAFVLSDALDRVSPAPVRPLVEVGALWQPGQAQPAWAELLRARRYLVESDGAGRLRITIPTALPGPPHSRAPEPPAEQAAREAFEDAWPVLRHVLAAERRRLGGSTALDVEVHAYRHAPELTQFRVGTRPYRTKIDDTRSAGRRPPPDLAAWQAFLDSGLRLEGARLDDNGGLTLLGSRQASPPTILGRPLTLADLAVAYRAVVHGGLAEPYMSLDRGYSPQTSIVNYGGRLRDTSLGLVSLLCDIRFKTFSLGLDIVEGSDMRARLREALPDFRSHMERFAEHPDSAGVMSQQTRLWFYPDRVDLTVSGQGDVLALRRVRMSAASERVGSASDPAAAEDPPWTRATVQAIDRDYDRLAAFFPELSDLDQVVRLLSLFTWFDQATRRGLLTPDLDALLALELPPLTTPRTYPQLLAFNALPEPGSRAAAEVFDRVPVAEAIERLNPAGGLTLPPRTRFERAFAALDRRDGDVARFLAEIGTVNPDALDDEALDALSHRAERLRMHLTVLATLDAAETRRVTSRQQAGESLRIFSVAIGGLDLGMGQALDRAGGQSLSIAGGSGAADSPAVPLAAGEAREAWRTDSPLIVPAVVPDHGLGAKAGPVHRTSTGKQPAEQLDWTWWLAGAESPDVISRKVFRGADGVPVLFERLEGPRGLRYRLDSSGSGWKAALVQQAAVPTPPADPEGLPPGLATLAVGPPAAGAAAPGVSPAIGVRLVASVDGSPRNLDADFPRALLQRLVVGRAADPTPDKALPALGTLPPSLGSVEALMTLLGSAQRDAPWDRLPAAVAGEEDPVRLARALDAWWSTDPAGRRPVRAVVGTDPASSPRRWAAAPRVAQQGALLLLPEGAFPGATAGLRARLAAAWPAALVVSAVPAGSEASLIVLVSGEAPGVFAARLAGLAASPALSGKLLAAWCLSGEVRRDLPARLLATTPLAGLGLAEASVIDLRSAAEDLGALGRSLAEQRAAARVETLRGPFLWYF